MEDPLSPVAPAAKSLIAAGVAAGVAGAYGAAEQDELLVVRFGNERITRLVLRFFKRGEWLGGRPYHKYIVSRCFYGCKGLNSRTRRQEGSWHPHPKQQMTR